MEHLATPEGGKEVPIRETGAFFAKDSDGYFINPAAEEKIQEEWRPVVQDIVEAYRLHYGDALHSVYVRGSVGKGDAIPHISDVDTFAYVTLKKDEIHNEWMDSFERETLAKYPFAQGIELSVDPLGSAEGDKIFILQSACVFGTDLNGEMPKMKVGKETLGNVYSLAKHLAWFDEWSLKPQTPEEIKKSCTWLMKRLLRTGLELTMERAGQYTRDLYPSYKLFSEYYPEKGGEMREALYLALNPSSDIGMVQKVRNNLGVWLLGQSSEYKM